MKQFLKTVNWSSVAKEIAGYAPVVAAALDGDPDTQVIDELSRKVTGFRGADAKTVLNFINGAKKSNPKTIEAIKNLDKETKQLLEEKGVNVDLLLSESKAAVIDFSTTKSKIISYISLASLGLGVLYEFITKVWG